MKTLPKLLGIAAVLCAGYSVIPTYYHKLIDPKAVRRLQGGKAIALTFDDGPDPRYTGALMDLLKENGVSATFFVVAKKADQHPELVDRMFREGHEVALHSFEHGNGLLKGFRYTKRDFGRCDSILRHHGWRVRYFRPPWGHSNLFTAYYAKKYGWKLAYWNVMAQDWKANISEVEIVQRLMRRVQDGSIICLHDSGGAENAPARTLRALRKAIPMLKGQGYRFEKIEN